MRKRNCWLALLLVLGLAGTANEAQAQGLDIPGNDRFVTPLGSQRPEQTGFFFGAEFMYWKQSNPLKGEPVAFRGIYDADGSIALGLGLTPVAVPGTFIGSHQIALDVTDISGPENYTQGTSLTFGYRMEGGVVLETTWIHLVETHFSATAGLTGPQPLDVFLANSFVTSPVFNFIPQYFGPGNIAPVGSAVAMFGLWDGDSYQTIAFVQRFDQWDFTARIPINDCESWRTYALMGPRIDTLWERFTWTAYHQEATGIIAGNDFATYTNVTSNRLYGVHAGVGNEWYLCDSPCGAFSLSLDVQGAVFADFMKGRPKYELGDKTTAAQHGRNLFSLVPEADADIKLWWYPCRGVVARFGFTGMAFFNTFSSPNPIDFNFGSITPVYQATTRIFQGFDAGIGFMF